MWTILSPMLEMTRKTNSPQGSDSGMNRRAFLPLSSWVPGLATQSHYHRQPDQPGEMSIAGKKNWSSWLEKGKGTQNETRGLSQNNVLGFSLTCTSLGFMTHMSVWSFMEPQTHFLSWIPWACYEWDGSRGRSSSPSCWTTTCSLWHVGLG